MDVSKIFEDEELKFYFHGTTTYGIVDSILKNGLMMYRGNLGQFSEGDLDLHATAKPVGYGGSDVSEDYKEFLENYSHGGSDWVVVLALPRDYIFPKGLHTYVDCLEIAYLEKKTFVRDFGEAGYDPLVNANVLMNEFIVGAYDQKRKKFIANESFFKNSNKKGRDEAFKKVHDNYVNILKNIMRTSALETDFPFTLDDFLNMSGVEGIDKVPLTPEEIEELNVYSQELLEQGKVEREKRIEEAQERWRKSEDYISEEDMAALLAQLEQDGM